MTKEILQKLVEETQHYTYVTKKLRERVKSIFNVFQNPKFCRHCESEADAKCHSLTTVEDVKDYHKFEASVDIPFEVLGETYFHQDYADGGTKYYRIVATPETKSHWPTLGIRILRNNLETDIVVKELPNKILKELIKTDAIPKFLNRMSQVLKETNAEYDEVEEMAKKLSEAISE
jgi:hypothetical protein